MADQRSARGRLFQRAEDRTPVADRRFGEGSYLRPSFIQPYRCRDVLIEDCTFTTGVSNNLTKRFFNCSANNLNSCCLIIV